MSDLTHGLKPFLWAHGMVLLVLTFVPALSLGPACIWVQVIFKIRPTGLHTVLSIRSLFFQCLHHRLPQ
jgi:hypothetical protein